MSGLARLEGATFSPPFTPTENHSPIQPLHFVLCTSHFLLPTSYFALCTLHFPPSYPFTPVNVIPSINNRCAKKKRTTIGSIVTNEAAIR